jgi:phosphoribosyl 1,2-cyclic phosphate phosphodiesterase
MKAVILGCGPSAGVPQLYDNYPPGMLADRRNHRLRSSIVVEHNGTRILVDTSPDLRQQLLREGITHLDAVCYTHAHADHCHGIDDLRRVCVAMNCAIPAYGNAATLEELKTRFGYVFEENDPRYGWYAPTLHAHTVEREPFAVGPVTVTPFAQDHIVMETLGFRFDAGGRSIAYSTDLKNLDDRGFDVVSGVDLWIVDCQNMETNPIHGDLERTLGWIARSGAKRAVLTHMSHDMIWQEVNRLTPDHVTPAWDGMTIVF